VPEVYKAEHIGLLIYVPEHAQFPIKTLANGSEDFMPCVHQGRRFGQHLGHSVLGHKAAFGTCFLSPGSREFDRLFHDPPKCPRLSYFTRAIPATNHEEIDPFCLGEEVAMSFFFYFLSLPYAIFSSPVLTRVGSD
jgi:hypothetical protein